MRFGTHHKFVWITLIGILALVLAGCKVAPNTQSGQPTPQLPQPKAISDPTWITIDQAIQKDVQGREDVVAFLLYNVTIDSVKFSDDGNTAVVWTALVDKNTGLVQSAEPGLVIAQKTADGQWSVVLQADKNFAAELQALPDSLIPPDQKAQYMPAMQQAAKDGVVYSGYRLPWGAGQSKYLTGSIGHVFTYKSCPDTCLYAFDFADGTMFPIAAAKAGKVKYAVWQYPNGNTTNTNYLVIEDDTTTPTTFMVYFHLAQNSIPPELRTPGAPVYQGEYLANADDTGASTGNHLHFMVHANADSYWGTSVDIVFDEVTVNGGRPRTCAEAASYPQYGSQCMPGNLYTSRNGDTANPTGGLTLPATNSIVTSPTVSVSGWMHDDTALESGQLMYKVADAWKPIGPVQTSERFTTQINLCDAGIPDGTFYLSLVVTDKAGKTSPANTGFTALQKQYTCPAQPPTCAPTAGEATIYSQANYQGQCQVLDKGNYASLASLTAVKDNQAASVQLGSGTSVLLYSDANFSGTQELIQSDTADLSREPIGAGTVSSIKVIDAINLPDAPVLTLPEHATSEDGVALSWTTVSGVDTRAELTGPNNYDNVLDWQSGGSWSVGLLAAGNYTLKVDARNLAGVTTISQGFTVSAPFALPVVTLNALPTQTNSTAIPLSWQVISGADNIDHFEIQAQVDGGDWTTWTTQPAAADRSTVYDAQMGHAYAFRIRGVLVTGKAVDFSTLASVATTVSAGCQPDAFEGTPPGDNAFAGASALEIGSSQQHNWCPAGDTDWVVFQATKGQVLRLTTSPVNQESAAVEQLYNTDGTTMLGENHPSDANSDASLDWTVPADGTYAVKYTPVDTKISGTDTAYSVKIQQQNTVQTTPLVCTSVLIPLLLGGGFTVASKAMQKKKAAKRAGWD